MTFNQVPNVNLADRGDGRGTIRFGQDLSSWTRQGYASWSPAFDPTPQFIAIEEARTVFEHIQTQLTKRD